MRHRSQGKGGQMRVREAHNSISWKGNHIGLRVKGDQMSAPADLPPRKSNIASGELELTPSS